MALRGPLAAVRLLILTGAAVLSGLSGGRWWCVWSHELCLDWSGPVLPQQPLVYCSMYPNLGCCQAVDDNAINAVVSSYSLAASTCAEFMKASVCSKCDPWSAHLWGTELNQHPMMPFFCPDYCAEVYLECAHVAMTNNPFLPAGTTNATTLASLFPNQLAFCGNFSLSDKSYCFDGSPFTLPPPLNAQDVGGLCLELVVPSIDNILGLHSVPGQKQLFVVYEQNGLISLYSNPGEHLTWTKQSDFLDLRSRVLFNGERGLLGFAFHPNYTANGLFYVHYSCSGAQVYDCRWTCDKGCLYGDCDGSGLCEHVDHTSVVAEYQVNLVLDPLHAVPTEHRRIFSVSQPFANHNGGQLLFGHADGMLYIMFGDGGKGDDPFNAAQDLQRYMGKILRLDVTSLPDTGRNYSIPSDNPFVSDSRALPEIWAFGLRNPWRCSFDSLNPTVLMCADVGQADVEEVDIIVKGGNYGWRRWEGTRLNFPQDNEPVPPPIPPVLEYWHREDIIGAFAEDVNMDLYLLVDSGVYLVANTSFCPSLTACNITNYDPSLYNKSTRFLPIIIGVTVGIGAIAVVAAVWWWWQRRRKSASTSCGTTVNRDSASQFSSVPRASPNDNDPDSVDNRTDFVVSSAMADGNGERRTSSVPLIVPKSVAVAESGTECRGVAPAFSGRDDDDADPQFDNSDTIHARTPAGLPRADGAREAEMEELHSNAV